jgi:hypothetical protein
VESVQVRILKNFLFILLLSRKIVALNLKKRFYSAFKPDFQGNVEFEEGIRLLKILNINSHNVLLTELRGKKVQKLRNIYLESFFLRLNF